jgi:hypothetical protein
MNTFRHIRLFSAALILALTISAAFTFAAFADEGTPPTDPAVPVEDGGQEAAADESDAPAAEEVSVEEIFTVEAVATEAVVELPTSEPEAITPEDASVLAELPEGTEIVIVDESGEAVSLASEEAAEILATSDPIWCPASVAVPKPSLLGCSASYASLTDLLTFLIADQLANPLLYQKDGTIWIEKTYDSGVDDPGDNFSLNGNTDFAVMNDYRLNIKGGWNGCGLTPPATCVGTIDMTDPSELNGFLYITNWNADVTLSDLLITGTSSTGLQVVTTKNITVTRVDSNSNSSFGAHLANVSGTGNITVSSSEFNANSNSGLQAFSNGIVTLTSVLASNNGQYGVNINNSSAVTDKNVTVSGTSEFNGNDSTGLIISSHGTVTLTNVTANQNGQAMVTGNGIYVTNTGSLGDLGIVFSGTTYALENYETNILALSDGTITASNLYANSSITGNGAYLNNSGAATAKAVMVTGTNLFKFNDATGLLVQSIGAVTLNNITANNNAGDSGVKVDNSYSGLAIPVTLTGTNTANQNWYHGFNIYTAGTVSASNLTANENGQSGGAYSGAYISNTPSPSLSPVTLSGTNTFNYNFYGLVVESVGVITTNNVTATGNTSNNGVFLRNDLGGQFKKGITMNGTNVANDNGNVGVQLVSFGPIVTNNITASDNAGTGVSLSNNGASTNQNITMNGINSATGNGSNGLNLLSKGAIKVNSVAANTNTTTGANVNNSTGTSASSVTFTGTNTFNGNGSSGLTINTPGLVSLSNISANDNVAGYGAQIVNDINLAAPQPVTLSGTNTFNNNATSSGLRITSYGLITTNNLTANGNGDAAFEYGAFLYNLLADPLLPLKGVTVNGTNSFNDNYEYGLNIQTIGPIKVNNVTVSNTTNTTGANLYNSSAPSAQAVSVTGVNKFTGNNGSGLVVTSIGAVTLNSITATENAGLGAGITNNSATTPQGVTLTGTSNLSNNDGGLTISSKGTVTITNVTASGNTSGYGAYISNTFGTVTDARGVTVSGTNVFNSNSSNGLNIQSWGAIALNNVTANNNSSSGANLTNVAAATPKNVTLTGVNTFSGNTSIGLAINTLGAITSATKLTIDNNSGSYGASLSNNFGGALGAITLNGTNSISGNTSEGLSVTSVGAITINNLTASNNGVASGTGAYLDNSSAATPMNITLSGTNTLSGNQVTGLWISTDGAVTLNNLTASDNITGFGLALNASTDAKAVTLNGTNKFNGNDQDGANITAKGIITLNNVTASDNGDDGLDIQNLASSAPQAVKLTGTNVFMNNVGYGVNVDSIGAVSANNVTATYNGTGMFIDNDNPGSVAATATVTLTGVNTFSYNTNFGLFIRALGIVTMAKVTADGNGADGVDLVSSSNVTITCGSINGNGVNGLDITTPGLVTLKGVISSGNGGTDILLGGGATLMTVRTC